MCLLLHLILQTFIFQPDGSLCYLYSWIDLPFCTFLPFFFLFRISFQNRNTNKKRFTTVQILFSNFPYSVFKRNQFSLCLYKKCRITTDIKNWHDVLRCTYTYILRYAFQCGPSLVSLLYVLLTRKEDTSYDTEHLLIIKQTITQYKMSFML